jgi:hypothetical protein
VMSTGCSKCGQLNPKDLLLRPYPSLLPAKTGTVVTNKESKFKTVDYDMHCQ